MTLAGPNRQLGERGRNHPRCAVLTVDFTLAGQRFIALNGGPQFPFTEAVSLSIDCEDQTEVDRLFSRG
jgi:predicted 3-demethylubiquinone-9 3-methyltransferase (glyoxalase superfamily)